MRGGWATCSAPSARWYDAAAGALLGGLYRGMAADLAAVAADLAAVAADDDGVAAAADGAAGRDVLEIGPGPGHLAVELARLLPTARVTGVDIDPQMVARARGRAAEAGVADRATFTVGDVGALDFPDASFDLVTSSFSAHHWPDGAGAFAQIRRVLRPGGRAVVYDLPDWWGHLERRALPLTQAAARGGFPSTQAAAFRRVGPVVLVQRLEVPRTAPRP